MLTYNFSRTPIIIYARKDRPISPFRPKDLVGIPWQEQRQCHSACACICQDTITIDAAKVAFPF